MSMFDTRILNALESIDRTLKRIAQALEDQPKTDQERGTEG